MMKPQQIPSGRILVTGAAGFIGSALVWALNCAGHEDILLCDRLDATKKFLNLVPLRFRDYIEADDLIEKLDERGRSAFGGVKTIIHLGACSNTTETDTLFLLRNNYEYTKRLALAALAADIRFVYASSAATYGLREDLLDDRCDISELRPVNMYAYSKQLFDLYAKRKGFFDQIIGLKYFNIFGPNEAHKAEMRSVVAKAYEQLQLQPMMTLFKSHRAEFADGEQRRDFLYVKDAVDATLFLAAHPKAHGLYNIGSGIGSTWNELALSLFHAMGRTPDIRYVDMPEHLRPAYQYVTCAALGRLREAGFTRECMSLADAVADYLPYLQKDCRLDPLKSSREDDAVDQVRRETPGTSEFLQGVENSTSHTIGIRS